MQNRKRTLSLLSLLMALIFASSGLSLGTCALADETIEIRAFIGDRADVPVTQDMPVFEELAKRTGVKIVWDIAPASGTAEKYNLVMASGDIPDMVVYTITDNIKYAEKGACLALNDLVAEYAPNFQRYLDESVIIRKDVSDTNGNVFVFPMLAAIKTSLVYMIRQDWMNNVGISQVPVTLDDWVALLTAFRDNDANGNGDPIDEVPFTFRSGWNNLNFYESFGVWHDLFIDKDGEIKFGPADPRFKEYLEFANKLYSEKLVDLEYVTMDTNLWQNRMVSSTGGASYDWVTRIDNFNTQLTAIDPNAQLVFAAPPVGPTGLSETRFQMEKVRSSSAAISSQTKHAEAIVKMFDYIYSDEGRMLMNFGIEGMTYNLVDGLPVYTDLVLHDASGFSPQQAQWFYGINRDFAFAQDPLMENAYVSDEVAAARVVYEQAIIDPFPKLKFTDEEKNIVNPIRTELDTYVDEMVDKMITGAEPVSNFDAFVDQLNRLGLETFLEYQNIAYQRYLQ